MLLYFSKIICYIRYYHKQHTSFPVSPFFLGNLSSGVVHSPASNWTGCFLSLLHPIILGLLLAGPLGWICYFHKSMSFSILFTFLFSWVISSTSFKKLHGRKKFLTLYFVIFRWNSILWKRLTKTFKYI